MEEFFEIIIFAIVIIANIIGGIIKVRQKRAKAKPPVLPRPQNSYKYAEKENIRKSDSASAEASKHTVKNIPSPPASVPVMENISVQELKVEDLEDEEKDSFDYGEFMHTHGREAFILAEIILPANSRQR